jgi:hypothetical protein
MNDATAPYPTTPPVPPTAGAPTGLDHEPGGAAGGPPQGTDDDAGPTADRSPGIGGGTGIGSLLVATAVGAGVSVALGAYGRLHPATGEAITTFGFPAVLPMKAWLATVAAGLALVQLASAAWMWGRLPGARRPAPHGVAVAHRWTGTVAFLVSLPVAYHCLWSLGVRTTDARVLGHSILGCAFYGAFVTKMLLLRSRRLPGWALPVAGGALVALLTGLWLTSALWFFTTVAFPGA